MYAIVAQKGIYVAGLWIFHIVTAAKVLDVILKYFQGPGSEALELKKILYFFDHKQGTNITVCNHSDGSHIVSL